MNLRFLDNNPTLQVKHNTNAHYNHCYYVEEQNSTRLEQQAEKIKMWFNDDN